MTVQVFGVDTDGGLWHTVRDAGGLWTSENDNGTRFGDVGRVVGGERGSFTAVAAFTEGSELHVLAATDNDEGDRNKLWHAVRQPKDGEPIREAGTWIAFKAEDRQEGARQRQFLVLESASGPSFS
jgi:hypothetical protein